MLSSDILIAANIGPNVPENLSNGEGSGILEIAASTALATRWYAALVANVFCGSLLSMSAVLRLIDPFAETVATAYLTAL